MTGMSDVNQKVSMYFLWNQMDNEQTQGSDTETKFFTCIYTQVTNRKCCI